MKYRKKKGLHLPEKDLETSNSQEKIIIKKKKDTTLQLMKATVLAKSSDFYLFFSSIKVLLQSPGLFQVEAAQFSLSFSFISLQ